MLRFLVVAFLFSHAGTTAAQQVIETSYWEPKNTISKKLVKQGSILEKYNSDGLLMEREGDLHADWLCEKTVYYYNEKKQLISETDLLPGGTEKNKREYAYDENGLLKTMTTKGRTKMLVDLTITEDYFYDGKNNLVKKIRSGDQSAGVLGSWIYEYKFSDTTKTITERFALQDKKRNRKFLTFNKNGLLTTVKQGYMQWFYEYTFDNSGDWIIRKVYQKISINSSTYVGEYRKTRIQ